MKLITPIEEIFTRLKKRQRDGLKRIGIHTVRDMLYHIPARYADTMDVSDEKLQTGQTVKFTGTIQKIGKRRTGGKKRVMISEATLSSENRKIRAVWFNQPYIAEKHREGEVVTIIGKISGPQRPYVTNPIIRRATESLKTATHGSDDLVAVYREAQGVSSLWLSAVIQKILSDPEIKNIGDPIPEEIRTKLHLPNLYDALMYIHKPRTANDHVAAKKRFIFEKTFTMQIIQQQLRHERVQERPYTLSIDRKQIDTFMEERFEFTPTEDQKKAVWDTIEDIQGNKPMARLLEGDVGSGKTVVAATVIYGTVTAEQEKKTPGRPQAVYLAPTEILARQQFHTLTRLLSHLPISVGLISGKECLKYPSKTNSEKATQISKAQLKKWIATGEVAVIVGTHAVIQKDVTFGKLALVIIDEQHRFGVAQRQRIISNNDTYTPHLLSMTATPIPRTLALTIYGDLDISVIESMPEGRKKVRTKLIKQRNKKTAYEHIRKEVRKGRQAYVLCPRIEESEESLLRSVVEEHQELSETVFPDLTVDILHGKMKQAEKTEVMERFLAGEVQVLVCTTVIEVGVNVQNATIIAILHAERFGLAQLHQLRGRVIRSTHQPYCYAITDTENELTMQRMKVFEKIHDGFELAQQDLEIRGSGELAGLRQSGIPDLVLEGLKNQKLLSIAQEEAKKLVHNDPLLNTEPTLREYIQINMSHRE